MPANDGTVREAGIQEHPPTTNGGGWAKLTSLGFEKGSQIAFIDTRGHFWLNYRDENTPRRITRDEALALTEFLVEEFKLVVVNPPEAWGWCESRCECDTVPYRVTCGHCGDSITVGDSAERPEW